jgi:hypothetical protein
LQQTGISFPTRKAAWRPEKQRALDPFLGSALAFNPDSEHRVDKEMSARQAIDTGDGVEIIANRAFCKSELQGNAQGPPKGRESFGFVLA